MKVLNLFLLFIAESYPFIRKENLIKKGSNPYFAYIILL